MAYHMAMPRPLAEIRETATAALRRYFAAEPDARTAILRDVAESLVDAREHFITADGTVDYRGRTYAYRRFVGEIFAGANPPADEVQAVQAAVRYHVGNVLRERLTPDTLEALGLRKESPKERSVEKRASESDALALLRGGTAFTTTEEIGESLRVVQGLLSRIDTNAVRALPDDERFRLVSDGHEIEAILADVLAASDPGPHARR